MTITYVNNLRFSEMADGDNSGTWGGVTNTNLEIIGQATAWGTRAIANASTDNITIADGALDADRCLGLKLTGGGQACTVSLLPNTSSKTWVMYNATSYTLTFTCGSGANVAILAGQTKIIATDGLGSGGVVHDLLTAVNLAGTTQTAAVTTQGTLTVGVDDTGYDVKFFGDTASAYMLWDTSADDLILGGAAGLSVNSTALVTGVLTTTAATVFNGGFASNAASTIATTDNTVNLTLTSTDADASGGPKMNFYRNSSSPAAGDILTQINHQGENDAGETVSYMYQNWRAAAVGDGAESGQFDINTYTAGTAYERLGIDPTETVFNQDSADLDFRVESNGNANMFGIDANRDSGAGQVYAGANDGPEGVSAPLHVGGLVNTRISIDGSTSSGLYMTDSGGEACNIINAGGSLQFFGVAAHEFVFNDTALDVDFRVESDTLTHALFVQGSDGFVGIGDSSPATALHVNGGTNATFTLESDAGAGASFINFAADGAATKVQISGAKEGASGGGSLSFSCNNVSSGTLTENMRIDAAGNVLVGKVASNFASAGIELLATDVVTITRSAATPLNVNRIGSSAGAAIVMHYNGSDVGSIDVAASSTSYNTSSDYRLKENVDYDWDATTRLKQLKPARFNFIVDETNTLVDGFLAHEVSSIVPEAITGTKDAMTTEVLYVEGDELPDGKSVGDVKEASVPNYQGIDQSKLVPLLIKTIQELEARITALEG